MIYWINRICYSGNILELLYVVLWGKLVFCHLLKLGELFWVFDNSVLEMVLLQFFDTHCSLLAFKNYVHGIGHGSCVRYCSGFNSSMHCFRDLFISFKCVNYFLNFVFGSFGCKTCFSLTSISRCKWCLAYSSQLLQSSDYVCNVARLVNRYEILIKFVKTGVQRIWCKGCSRLWFLGTNFCLCGLQAYDLWVLSHFNFARWLMYYTGSPLL